MKSTDGYPVVWYSVNLSSQAGMKQSYEHTVALSSDVLVFPLVVNNFSLAVEVKMYQPLGQLFSAEVKMQ